MPLAAERQGNLIGFASGLWGDSSGHWSAGGSFGDIGNLVLRRNGEPIGESYYTFGVFDVPAEDAEYELQLNTMKIGGQTKTWKRSTEVTTVWKFRSHLDEDVYSQGLPVMFPRIDLPEDGMKTLAAKAGQKLVLKVTGHAGYTPGADHERRPRLPPTTGSPGWMPRLARRTASGSRSSTTPAHPVSR